ncbi:MAG: ABC transporter permease [Bacteroidaceae bacterium]|nr:ABC transporter permease [Bacteroidaceae bacterium]
MKFEYLISRRYLFSKKSHNAINIVSLIAVVGVAVATAAMVIVMSVFNGFQGLVAETFTAFDPELRVMPRSGSTIDLGSDVVQKLSVSKDIAVLTPVVEGQALAVAGRTQKAVVIKGVADNYLAQSGLADAFYGEGDPTLNVDVLEYCIPGIQLCSQLELPLNFLSLQIYAPKQGERVNMANPKSSFRQDELLSTGLVFNVRQSKYDGEYILCSIGFAQRLFGKEGKATALEIKLSPTGSRESIEALLGPSFIVQDRSEQQEDIFRIMKIEKLISFAFLCFILLVACLNIIGSLSMLMIEKQDDLVTLSALGATRKQIRRIFFSEGMMIIAGGALAGMLVAVALCMAQQTFGFIRLGQQEGSFITDAYPVILQYTDLLLILFTVLSIGGISVFMATRRAR